MINLVINGKKVQKDGHILFKDFLSSLNKDLAEKSQVVSMLRIDGEYIDENKESVLSMRDLAHMGSIEITTIDSVELAFDALQSAKQYIKKIIPYCISTGELYKNNEIQKAESNFGAIVNSLENLTNLVMSSQGVLRTKFKNIHTNDSSLRIAQVRLVSAVEELLPAKQKNDIVMLADVLCNELPGALQEMCDYGIPVLQRLRNA